MTNNQFFRKLYFSATKALLIAVSFAVAFACEKKDEVTLPDPVNDGELVTDLPRLGLTSKKKEELLTKLSTPQWTDMIGRMSNQADGGEEQYGFGAYHFAVAFAATNDQKYADLARAMIFRVIEEPGYCDLTSSYLRAPGCTGQVALAADIIFDQLNDEEKSIIFDYLEGAARGIVELDGWSGWGWQEGNPAYRQLNNYYPGHIQTILNYALLAYNHRGLAREYYQLVVEQELPAAFDMMRAELAGGHGAEGTWYDDKLMGHYAEVVLMLREATGGAVDFGAQYADVFADYATWRLYSIMNMRDENGKPRLYDTPTGDQPAVAEALVIDLARQRLWLLYDVLKTTDRAEVAGFIRYFEENIDFESKGWQREINLYYLLHFGAEVPSVDFTQALPGTYFAEGKGVAHYRTGWDNEAMALTIHFSPSQGQRNSHWHFGESAFYIWYKGWQADHLNRVGSSGIDQNTALMNTLLINGDENSQGQGDAEVLAFKGGDNYMAVKGNAAPNYKGKLEKFERTLVVTGKFISVYDHVTKANASDVVNFVVNNESGFSIDGSTYSAQNKEGQIVVKTVAGVGQAQLKDMGVRVDFSSADKHLDLLHALQVGENGSSAATVLSLGDVGSNAGEFFGVQFLPQGRSFVHLVNKTDALAASITYQASFGAGAMEHVIVGMEAGEYSIQKDGVEIAEAVVGGEGVLYFQSESGGFFEIEK